VTATVRWRFWIEFALASTSAVMLVLTVSWNDWIEMIFGVDPDHHQGSLEWLLVAALVGSTLVFSNLARCEWRRPLPRTR